MEHRNNPSVSYISAAMVLILLQINWVAFRLAWRFAVYIFKSHINDIFDIVHITKHSSDLIQTNMARFEIHQMHAYT